MSRVPAKPTVANTRLTVNKSGKSPSGQAGPSGRRSVDLTASDSGAAIPARRLDSGVTDGSDASDESADDPTSPAGDAAGVKWSPPSGTKVSDYRGWDKWGKREWAWEFLRRNGVFQIACNESERDDARVAQDYRLREFKHFARDYAVERKPRFASGIYSIPRRAEFVERNKHGSGLAEVRTMLFPSEVLIRFQLAPTRLALKTSFKLQREQVCKRLEKFAKLLRAVQPNDEPGQHLTVQTFAPEALLAQLRVLDMERTDPNLNFRTLADALLQNPHGQFSNRDWLSKTQSGQGSNLYEGAKRLLATDYLKIVIAGVKKATSEDVNSPTVKPRFRRK